MEELTKPWIKLCDNGDETVIDQEIEIKDAPVCAECRKTRIDEKQQFVTRETRKRIIFRIEKYFDEMEKHQDFDTLPKEEIEDGMYRKAARAMELVPYALSVVPVLGVSTVYNGITAVMKGGYLYSKLGDSALLQGFNTMLNSPLNEPVLKKIKEQRNNFLISTYYLGCLHELKIRENPYLESWQYSRRQGEPVIKGVVCTSCPKDLIEEAGLLVCLFFNSQITTLVVHL